MGKYQIIDFNKNLSDEEYGIIVTSIDIIEKHTFEIPLCDLEVIDKKSKYYLLIEDYSYWYNNYR